MADTNSLDDCRGKLVATRQALAMFEARNMRFVAGGVDLTEEGRRAVELAITNLEKAINELEGPDK